MRKQALALAALLLAGTMSILQTAAAADTGSGFDTERLQRIDDVINAEIESGRIPGAVGLIAKDGEIVYHRAFGMADIDTDNPRYPVAGAKRYFSGGAGLSSTAYDYFRFVQMLLQHGELDGVRLLSRKSVELMQAPRIDWDADGTPDFGLGFEVVTDLGRRGELGTVGTYSWGGAFGTNFLIDPKEDIVAIFMTQARPLKSDIRDRYRNLVYQALR